MARLMATIDDDRNPFQWKGRNIGGNYNSTATGWTKSRVHRLANQWSEVAVQTWDIRVKVRMNVEGHFLVEAQDLATGTTKILSTHAVESLFHRTPPKRTATGRIIPPKVKKIREKKPPKPRLTAAQKRELAKVNQLFGVSA